MFFHVPAENPKSQVKFGRAGSSGELCPERRAAFRVTVGSAAHSESAHGDRTHSLTSVPPSPPLLELS